MTKMSKAQRAAILDAHERRMRRGVGQIIGRASTRAALRRGGWTRSFMDLPTRAGLIAAGVNMDAIHAEAITENAR
ncbi:MAG: hypothetical protein ACJ72N_27480 [Labedaea sp.]